MTKEAVTIDGEYLDHIEELLDALSDGFGINAPGPDDADLYEQMLTEIHEARQ